MLFKRVIAHQLGILAERTQTIHQLFLAVWILRGRLPGVQMGVDIEFECVQPGFDTVFSGRSIRLDLHFRRGRGQPHFAQYRQQYLRRIAALVTQCINVQPQAAECICHQAKVGFIDRVSGVAELGNGGARGVQHLAGVVELQNTECALHLRQRAVHLYQCGTLVAWIAEKGVQGFFNLLQIGLHFMCDLGDEQTLLSLARHLVQQGHVGDVRRIEFTGSCGT